MEEKKKSGVGTGGSSSRGAGIFMTKPEEEERVARFYELLKTNGITYKMRHRKG